jgi:metal-dependent amidase/aminoacylase/carboxypeptidase family protein
MAAVLGTALTAVTNAQTINQRRENQQDRIAQGIQSGSLTAGEAARLETKEARLNRQIRDDREDHNGHLTKAQRTQINRQQNKLSRHIYRAKHN